MNKNKILRLLINLGIILVGLGSISITMIRSQDTSWSWSCIFAGLVCIFGMAVVDKLWKV